MVRPTTLKLHDFSNESFIQGCYIPYKICDDVIKYFDEHPDRQVSGTILDANDKIADDDSKKKSTDIGFDIIRDKEDTRLLSEYLLYLNLCIREYEHKYDRAGLVAEYNIIEGMNLQKYEPGEGFKIWHCERNGLKDQTRCLVFMTYLNDVEDGGETEFLYLKKRIQPKRDRLLIFPAGFTHTHRGNQPISGDKYIITGWLEYNS